VKGAQKNPELLKCLESHIGLISEVLVTIVKTSDSWQQKKVKKTMLALAIFTKLGKTALNSETKNAKFTAAFEKGGVALMKAIEDECIKDSSMSNLKGKIKEIKTLVTNS